MEQNKGLSSNLIKFIAILAMTCDHVTSTIWPGYNYTWYILILHLIGRITAPIMCYLITEGFHHTRNAKKYALRLFLLAFVSHFAYNFAFGIPFIPFKSGFLNQTSVLWPLALGVTALIVKYSTNKLLSGWRKTAIISILYLAAFPADWSSIAVFWITYLDDNRGNMKGISITLLIFVSFYVIVYCLCLDLVYGLLQFGVILSVPIIKKYNGTRGSWKGMKWFFYIYYPLHLVICGILRIVLH